MTKVLSTGALEASVSGFDSRLCDKYMGPWLNGLQCHPVTVCGAGSNPVGPAKLEYRIMVLFRPLDPAIWVRPPIL